MVLTIVYKKNTIVNMNGAKLIIQPKKYREATSVVSARIPNDMIRKLDETAEKTGYNRNEIISICLEFAIEHMEEAGEAESGRPGKGGRK